MSFFEDASLVLIPSAQKTSKVYSVKPTDGTGDLAFTRSNDTATRVASSGLIEKVRTNLALRSQSFATSAVWSTSQGTITNNAGTAPDGTNTASKIVATNADPYVYQPLTLTGSVAVSCYVKGVGSSIGKTARILVNASTTDVTMDGTWQRISVAHTAAGAESYGLEIPQPAATSDEVLMWGFQVEYGDVPTDYIATTTAAVSVGPVANVPRLDYLNSSCPRLLLEPQRTNVLTFSEQFNNAAWATDGNGAGEIKTANYAVSPDGTQNADRIQLNRTGGTYSRIRQDYTGAGNHTGAVYLKSNTGASQKIWMRVNGAAVVKITITTSWQRFVVSQGSSAAFELFIDNTDAEIATIADFSAWGAQLEVGDYATSYIPTTTAAVTRNADAASKTGISSLIGQTEGTIYFEYPSFNSDYNQGLIGIDDGSGNNRILFYSDTNNRITAQVRTNGVTQQPSSYSVSGNVKVAIAYNSTGFVFYVNGTLRFTGTAVVFSNTMSVLTFNHVGVGGSITDQALLFTTRLTNAQLAELTTI